jgi:uncharacterized protein YciI
MYVLELTFSDDKEQRLAARPAHRAKLTALHQDGRLIMAGPWPDDSGAPLVFDADEAGVREIMADDPYYATPGVTVAALRQWNPVVGP